MDKGMIEYKLKRKLRRLLPYSVSNFFMEHNVFIKRSWYEGKELCNKFISYLPEIKVQPDVKGKKILELGFGGLFELSCEFLNAGASQVVLVDPFSSIRATRNKHLYSKYPRFFFGEEPNPDYLLVVKDTLDNYAEGNEEKVDLIVSNSVLEHVIDVASEVRTSYRILKPSGISIHIVDLRDHLFKYPFAMLNFSEREWARYNPPSNLNRLRFGDYKNIFSEVFPTNEFIINARLTKEYEENKHRLHSDFQDDSEFGAVSSLTIISSK